MDKTIFYFSETGAEGNASMKDILGGKGANLAEMSNLGLPIPPGFTINTSICSYYYNNHTFPVNFNTELHEAIRNLERLTGKVFAGTENPLLLSVRSGSRASMPGMMDTILNLGLNDEVVASIAKHTGNERFAFDIYQRFIQMYSSTVLGISSYLFEDIYENYKTQFNILKDSEISAELLKVIVKEFKELVFRHINEEFPQDPYYQLQTAIEAVLKSWMSSRAIVYRKLHDIPEEWGTAVNVQSMVFGNMGDDSATGVAFTRNPSTGEKKIFGEFLINAQGEDVVAGIRTPMPIAQDLQAPGMSMQELMPEVFNELINICYRLETHYKDIQDIEFTIEKGKLYILQTRNGKRSAAAAIKVAVDLVKEGKISKSEALLRVDPESLNQLLHAGVDYTKNPKAIAQGLPASPGAATGIVVFSPYDAEELSHHHKVILVRNDTSPEDIKGMHVSEGILTARGGMTSHAAVVARGMGKPCVCGVHGITINEDKGILKIGEVIIKKEDEITIDGTTGKVFLGRVALTEPHFSDEFEEILTWANAEKTLAVRANAETPLDAEVAIKFGAEGIGLCRTEHMFFDKNKIPLVREMIIAPTVEHRQQAINKLLPLQIQDFKELFRIMKGKPINIRLLDPPLHEFLPRQENEKAQLAENLNLPLSVINHRLHALHEVNPMLGHRGCRLGITYPEIYQMQVEAIFTSIQSLRQEEQIDTNLELMLPLISNVRELKKLKEHIKTIIDKFDNYEKCNYQIGTMIELPRAALRAGEIAEEVDYFSFGTNDLTQTTYGISRDDIASFLPFYLEEKIFEHDPFIKIDEEGVGELMSIAVERGRRTNPTLKLGICGEHGGNPQSITFCQKLGLSYISCSPYRIPIARLAAAQAKIKSEQK